MRILHTADFQIGRTYSRFDPEDAMPIAEERFKVVERLASLATERQVDAILVAGDVFD
ncbi:MAG TPA: DNA repair exonuclease, partial [Chromatiales bacterium]|nr:DNA repair exonuclease [Chromatiales bacterium]